MVIRGGLFSAAGIFALTAVIMVTGLYVIGLRVLKMFQEQEVFRRDMLETSVLYASPPRSPPPPPPPPGRLVAVPRESPGTRSEWISDQTVVYSSAMLGHKLSYTV